jgi:chorismate mutase/prephenate dehydratase
MDLNELRDRIDEIDSGIVRLISDRMEVVREVAKYKAASGKPVYDPQREREKLARIAAEAGEDLAPVTDVLFGVIFDLSRSAQHRMLAGESAIRSRIKGALENTQKQFPVRPVVACQGIEGAYSQLACERMFPSGSIMYFRTFDSVFSAVEQGLCQYGILPLENSTAGSVNRIYDLMMEHECFIIRSCRVKVDHCLLAKKGVRPGDIKEIFSHEQAIAQCQGFLENLKHVKVTPCANTAEAARMVSESERCDIAALSSPGCAGLYGLECLDSCVQDKANNYTRFICISKKLEIYPGANRTSLMVVLPNRRGSLYRALSRFNALGINLLKLESRPLVNSDFEFMFYFDLEVSVYSDEFLRVFDDLDGAVTSLKYLGSYTEVV